MKKTLAIVLAVIMCLGILTACSKEAAYTPVTAMADALMEVKAGTADAAVVDSVMAEAMVGEGTDYSELGIADGVVLAEEEYGIGFRSGSNVVGKVNEAIQALIDDGTLGEIAAKYDLSLSLIDEVVPSDDAAQATEDDWAYIQDKGSLVIGITEYAPMNYYDESGKLIGFDTEFAEAVCAYLGIKAEFIVINWETKEIELNAKSIDCIWNGLTVDDDRKANMDFSASYMLNKQIIVAKSAVADKITAADGLSGKKLVAEAGSAGEGVIQSLMEDGTIK